MHGQKKAGTSSFSIIIFYSCKIISFHIYTEIRKKKLLKKTSFLMLTLQLSLWVSWASVLWFCSVPLPVLLNDGKWHSRMLGWRNESLNEILETLLTITPGKMWIYFIPGIQFLHGVNCMLILIRRWFIFPFCWLLRKNTSKNTFSHDNMTDYLVQDFSLFWNK